MTPSLVLDYWTYQYTGQLGSSTDHLVGGITVTAPLLTVFNLSRHLTVAGR